MVQALKSFVDRTTMYVLVLEYLLALLAAALVASAYGLLSSTPGEILWSTAVLLVVGWAGNELLARLFGAVTNNESAVITALILALILPPVTAADVNGTIGLALIAFIANASKYVVSIGKKHLFNPAAFAVVVSAFVFDLPATWWIAGNLALIPLMVVGGLLVVYKLRRFDLLISFFAVALAATALTSGNPLAGIQATLLHSAIFFLAFAMLTEPLTMPSSRRRRIAYGAIVGALFTPTAHLGSFYLSPEIALVAGNLFSYLASPKGRYTLTLVRSRELARGIREFFFTSDRRIPFVSGQYLEWTLGGVPFDQRGNRRYFTVASAPEDAAVTIGVRFAEASSAFKRTLIKLPPGGTISAVAPAGDFTLPARRGRKLGFIAGGIGVTPFASMARHLLASGDSRDAVLLYASRSASEIAYQDLFAQAAGAGLRTVYALSDESLFPGARRGRIDAAFIEREVPDYRERLFYVSGPPGLVSGMRDALRALGVPRSSIKTDYFPGFA